MTTPTVKAPAGMVTFVFTDIEGSTRLFNRLGDRYVVVLERHNSIIRDALASHGGYEVSTDGDAFFAAFEDARRAVAACADMQRNLGGESWPEGAEVRVRIGVHTGLASPHGGDYVALAVHQASRIVAAAHGGLVLVSQDTVDAVKSSNGIVLQPLGHYRLRDFDEPLALYRLVAPGLRDVFPALRAVPADNHNIVPSPTPTVGRDDLIADITDQVEPGRLVTLVGPGGVGKTRTVAELGIHIAPAWPAGVWLVDLSTIGDPDLVVPAVADATGAPRQPDRQRLGDVLEHLGEKSAVVILDNAEHVLESCRALIEALQANCPGVALIAASRVPIRSPGEILWHVDPLETPDASHAADASVSSSPAVRLFVERASAVRPGFVVDKHSAAAVADICRHLDGLPLSIEMAAAHLAYQSPEEIRAALDERFQLLRSPSQQGSDRHQTVEGILEWSYGGLSEDERTAFRSLSVFGGAFSIETAQSASGALGIRAPDLPMLVWSLIDRSLVVADLSANETRYRLLETMRTYGRHLLDAAGETSAVVTTLARALLDRIGPWLEAGRRWLGDAEVEVDNLRALIDLMPGVEEELAQQIACTIGLYHDGRQSFRDGIDETERYALSLQALTPTRVSLLCTLADLYLRTAAIEAAERLVAEAAGVHDLVGAPAWDDAGVYRTRGEIALRTGDLEAAGTIARETLSGELSDRGRNRMLNLLGIASVFGGDSASARDAFAQQLEISKRIGNEGNVANAHGNLAEVAMRVGDNESAALHQAASLDLGVVQGSSVMVAFSLIVAARLAGERPEWATAVRLHGHAEALLDVSGIALYAEDRELSERLMASARDALGAAKVDALVSEGEDLDLMAAVDIAQAVFESFAR